MGYMGFGMRKEIYTRKPKFAFEKIKKLYEQEIIKSSSNKEVIDTKVLDEGVKQAIRAKLKKQRWIQITISVLGAVAAVAIITILILLIVPHFEPKQTKKTTSNSHHFSRKNYYKNEQLVRISDYYIGGSKASETRYKNGLKHQSSESYYMTGEKFRSALYNYDTLVAEYYFFKSGDTIKNFPQLDPQKIMNVSLPYPDSQSMVKLKILDHKVIMESYPGEKGEIEK